jgi:tetratricopeptide (TPR) repeat protein
MNIDNKLDLVLDHFHSGKLKQAQYLCRKILKKQPDNINALHYLGVIYHQLGDIDSAIQCIIRLLEVDPSFAEAYNNLGNIYQDNKQLDNAISCYQKALQINPSLAQAYFNLGIVLQDTGRLDEAISSYEKALNLNYYTFGIHNNLGLALHDQERSSEAIQFFQKSIQLNPYFADAYYNLGNALASLNQTDEAISFYQKALQLNPDYVEAHWNLALASLLSGDFQQGLKEYEWRWKLKGHYQYHFAQPLWDGSDIGGKTILLHAEQGFGDTIQFIRYASLLADQGANVIVQCQNELTPLFTYTKGIQQVISFGEAIPLFDIHCPLASLPLLFETSIKTIPSYIPYLFPDPEVLSKWKNKLEDNKTNLKIGLVWSGNPKHKNDLKRSCSLETFSSLAHLDKITLYSLQKGDAAKELLFSPKGMRIVNHTDAINDFLDTAGHIDTLDLVISVDTSVAHLAGALGKPVWILLPYNPDWRWLLNCEDSPWYPTMRLFRQPNPGDWESVMIKVANELTTLSLMHYRLHSR